MNKIFLDLGAWTGNSIAKFEQLYPDHSEYKIYSFEPHPDSAKRFRVNYPNIELIEAAVWEEDTERTLRVGSGKWIEGCTLVKQKRLKRYDKSLNVKVRCIDFDAWVRKRLNKDDYIVAKFNIEGAEYKVIDRLIKKGTIEWFNELWIEWHNGKMEMSDKDHIDFVNRIPQEVKHWGLDHKKKTVYTVITDPRYSLIEPLRLTKGWDYVCFVSVKDIKHKYYDMKNLRFVEMDKPITWELRYIPPGSIDPRKLSRKIKILHDHFLPGNDISVYVDTRFTVKCNLDSLSEENLKGDICLMEHNRRKCLFREAEYLLKSNKLSDEDKQVIKRQVARYKNFIVPDFGLWAPGIMIRKHGVTGLRDMMRVWYEQMLAGSHRDIISFPFAYRQFMDDVKLDSMEFKHNYEMFMVREGEKPRIPE